MGIKDIPFPFSPESEEDVRFSLAMFFIELGFEPEEMIFESSFQVQLGHTTIDKDKDFSRKTVSGRNDLLLSRNGLPLAMVELKAPNIELSEQDRDQGLSYARLLRNMPPYTIVTNGIEIRIYDTLTTDIIDSGDPSFSTWWKNGGTYQNLGRVDKEWASKTLLSLSRETFKQFSDNQVNLNLSNLISTPESESRFSSTIYVPRQNVLEAWDSFLNTDYLFFGIYGESGAGKTNELCSLVQSCIHDKDKFVLFYKGIDLWDGITKKIRNDFNWEFGRDESIAIIMRRFLELAHVHDLKFIIFIDGLDETPLSLRLLKGELVELCNYLNPTNIRFCISCKTLDWRSYVFDRSDQINNLGKKCYPTKNDSGLPGMELYNLTEDELSEAWQKYKTYFCLSGDIEGETRELCKFPLTLRLLAETYRNSIEPIPPDLSDIAIFKHYWHRKISDFDRRQQLVMEKIIATASQIMVLEDKVEIDESRLFNQLSPEFATSSEYNQVIRYGFLQRRNFSDGSSQLTFPFNKLRHFVYTIKAQKWPEIVGVQKRKQEVLSALKTQLGREALFFFLEVDRDVPGWIFPIIENDLALFISLVLYLKRFEKKEGAKNIQLRLTKLAQFITIYSELREQFSKLKLRLAPFSEGKAGLLLSEWFHSYRTCTESNPQLIAIIDKEYLGMVNTGKLPLEMEKDLKPDYGSVSNRLYNSLESNTSYSVAFSEIERQIKYLIEKQLLNESQNPIILIERVSKLLKSEPNSGMEGSPKGKFWQLLQFDSYEEAISPTSKLAERSLSLYEEWKSSLLTSSGGLKRWYEINIYKVNALHWYFVQLSHHSWEVLPTIIFETEDLFSYLNRKGFERTSEIALSIAPYVISEYRYLIQENFNNISYLFDTYNNLNCRLLLELSEDTGHFKSDFLHLTFIWLPSIQSGPITLRFVKFDESLSEVFIINQKSADNIFAKNIPIKTRIDGNEVIEDHAVISRVKYPDRNPISSIAYQLIMNEFGSVFGNSFGINRMSSSDNYEDVFHLLHGGLINRMIIFRR